VASPAQRVKALRTLYEAWSVGQDWAIHSFRLERGT